MKRTSFFIASLLLAAAPALVSAALVINPATPGAAVSVTGSGANANGYVELFLNGTSQGSVQADATGAWTTTVDLAEGDVLTAILARVWNFNSDGDPEGWSKNANDTQVVAGGIMTITSDAASAGNMSLAFNDTSVVDPAFLHVLEIGYRLTGTVSAPGVVLTNSSNGGPFGPSWTPTANLPTFRADLIDLTDLQTGNQALTPNNGWTGTINQIGVGFNGVTAGNTFEVDFIRLRQTVRFDFPFDGNDQGFTPANAGGLETIIDGISGGILTARGDGAGKNITILPNFQTINPSVYNQYNVRMTQFSDVNDQPVQLSSVAFFYNGWAAYTPFTAESAPYTADYGNPITVNIDLSTVTEWGTPMTAINLGQGLMFAPNATDYVELDYIEYAPSGAIADAAPVVVTEFTSITDWTLFN